MEEMLKAIKECDLNKIFEKLTLIIYINQCYISFNPLTEGGSYEFF